jgi:SWI/SNF-related matrix-associated actin-dependent regulator of chromatin subfamily A3
MRLQTGAAGTSVKGRPTSAIDSAKAARLSGIMENLSRLDDTSRRETLLNTLCGDDVLELPVHPSPPSVQSGLLNTDLLKHQVRP